MHLLTTWSKNPADFKNNITINTSGIHFYRDKHVAASKWQISHGFYSETSRFTFWNLPSEGKKKNKKHIWSHFCSVTKKVSLPLHRFLMDALSVVLTVYGFLIWKRKKWNLSKPSAIVQLHTNIAATDT